MAWANQYRRQEDKERLPIKEVARRMNDEFYTYHATYKSMLKKYHYYTEDEIREALGIYDLAQEPKPWCNMPPKMKRQWEDTCKRLNPRAWR